MVFFTCNHCGESAKKPAVAKHYQFKCRNVPIFVSCMDCQKDFKNDEYVAHTSCITEAEKYSGKEFVPKASFNAGLRKQQTWLEVVRSILGAQDLGVTSDVRRVLQRLQSFDNVPRKKEKFLNFVSNSLRIKRFQAEPVWDVVEVALDKYKEIRFGSAKPNADASNGDSAENCNGSSQNANSNGDHNETEANGEKEKESSKKRKKEKNENKENGGEIAAAEDTIPKKKKKKSKDPEQIIGADTSVIEETGKKNKKKKKRSKEAEVDVSAPAHEEPLTNGVVTNGNVPTRKQKKTSSESEQARTPAPSEPKVVQAETKPVQFDWTGEIYTVLEKNANEIELETLKKRVLKKYKKFHSVDEIAYKVEKTFNKKLKKSGLLVVNNLVKARS